MAGFRDPVEALLVMTMTFERLQPVSSRPVCTAAKGLLFRHVERGGAAAAGHGPTPFEGSGARRAATIPPVRTSSRARLDARDDVEAVDAASV